MTARATLLKAHRWAGLAAAALWLLQAVTGMAILFHWEIDDLTVPGAHRAADFAAIDARAKALAPPGSGRRIASIWTSAGAADRFDINVEAPAPLHSEAVRVDGAGTMLRVRRDDEGWAHGGWMDRLVTLHQSLLAGDTGKWLIGASGILLVTNLLAGLWLGWPRRRTWRRSLWPPRAGPAAARLTAWHRAIGLWAAVPAALAVSAGTILAFEDAVTAAIAPEPVSAPPEPWRTTTPVAMPQAIETALARHPGARVSAIYYPSPDDATYRFRLRAPGEAARAYGNTNLFVSANDGRVTADFDARRSPLRRRFIDALFPFHTGEIAGIVGRVAMLAIGVWLTTMVWLGATLWWTRNRLRRR